MLAYAEKAMLPDLAAIWQEAFGDTNEYIDFFFSHKLVGSQKYENQIIWMEEENPVSMLTILKAKIWMDDLGKEQDFWYIYAVATKKEWQNRGIAGKMLQDVYQMAKKAGAVTGLVPASEKLFNYYGKLGYETVFYIRRLSWKLENKRQQKKLYKISEVDSKTYKKIRDKQFSGTYYVKWDQDAISYAFLENTLLHGVHYEISYQGNVYLLFGCKNDTMFYIKETTVPEEILEEVVTEIGLEYGCTQVEVRLPVNGYDIGSIVPFGMIRTEGKNNFDKKGYLGLALD